MHLTWNMMTAESLIKQHVKKSKIPVISVGLIDENGTQFFNYEEIKKDSEIIQKREKKCLSQI